MKNEIVSLSLSTDSIIAIIGIVVTVLIPVIGGIYKIVTSTKKYELTENYRKELLQWYTSVVEIMIRIIHSMESQEFFSDEFQPQKTEMLSRLSALTEIGRFYFPNVIKGDYFGHDKPSAYQGYRDICLEFLVYFYNTSVTCRFSFFIQPFDFLLLLWNFNFLKFMCHWFLPQKPICNVMYILYIYNTPSYIVLYSFLLEL